MCYVVFLQKLNAEFRDYIQIISPMISLTILILETTWKIISPLTMLTTLYLETT